MFDSTLKAVFYAAMNRIQKLKASEADLALVLIMSEFIDALGGSAEMAKIIDQLEANWKKGLAEYARGEV